MKQTKFFSKMLIVGLFLTIVYKEGKSQPPYDSKEEARNATPLMVINSTDVSIFNETLRTNSIEIMNQSFSDNSLLIVGENASLHIEADENSPSFLNNNGGKIVSDKNSSLVFIDNTSGSEGQFIISSNELDLNNLRIKNLGLDNGSGLYIYTNIKVQDTLELSNGYINIVDTTAHIYVDNHVPSSIKLNEADLSVNSPSIKGTLWRKMIFNNTYLFPSGGEIQGEMQNMALKIKSNNTDTIIFKARFIEGTLDYLYPNITDQGILEIDTSVTVTMNDENNSAKEFTFEKVSNTGGWLLDANSDMSGASFDISAYHLETFEDEFKIDNAFALINYKDDKWIMDNGLLPIENGEGRLNHYNYAKKIGVSNLGFYALATLKISSLVEFPNLISLSGGVTRYLIPDKYHNLTNVFTCYSKVGRKVYSRDNYSDQLDLKELELGVYYYNFVYTSSNNTQEIIRGFFHIVE